jgi:hypothetical protein
MSSTLILCLNLGIRTAAPSSSPCALPLWRLVLGCHGLLTTTLSWLVGLTPLCHDGVEVAVLNV